MKATLADMDPAAARTFAWEQATAVTEAARSYGLAGAVVTGVKFATVTGDAADWRTTIVDRSVGE